MKTVAVVPMKLNSRRLPQKNIKPFSNGRPLCCYILETLCGIDKIDEVYVYCSEESIKTYLPPKVTLLKRDRSLDQDTTKMNEILKSFAEEVYADVYIMTHTTAPFITKESIMKGWKAVTEEKFD